MQIVEACTLHGNSQQGRGGVRAAAAALLLALTLHSSHLSAAALPVISPDVPLVWAACMLACRAIPCGLPDWKFLSHSTLYSL